MRVLLVIAAVLFPVAIAAGFVYFALPKNLPARPQNATAAHEAPKVDTKNGRALPLKLDDARAMAAERLAQLKAMTQEQWEEERQLVMYRQPPRDVQNARARAQLRIDDLAKMTQADWERERRRIMKRDGMDDKPPAPDTQKMPVID